MFSYSILKCNFDININGSSTKKTLGYVPPVSTGSWTVCPFKSLTTRLFVQQLVQANNREKLKLLVNDPLWWESAGDRWIPFTKGYKCRKRFRLMATHECTIIAFHYIDVIMTTMASQITSLTVVYSIVYSGEEQRKHQNSASLAFVRGIHRTKGQ